MVAPPEPDWDRLAEYVRARRGPRSQKAVTAAGGPSDTTISKIEAARWRPTRGVDDTLQKLDVGLHWPEGSSAAILAGGEPGEKGATAREPSSAHWLDGVSTADIIDEIRVLFAEVRRRVAVEDLSPRGVVPADDAEEPPNWGRGFRSAPTGDRPRVRRDQ